VVSEAFPLERGADAHRFMGERRNIGKVVLTV
jgi:NADPH:quinone reductase-like Zn-dependent oxidoreductase